MRIEQFVGTIGRFFKLFGSATASFADYAVHNNVWRIASVLFVASTSYTIHWQHEAADRLAALVDLADRSRRLTTDVTLTSAVFNASAWAGEVSADRATAFVDSMSVALDTERTYRWVGRSVWQLDSIRYELQALESRDARINDAASRLVVSLDDLRVALLRAVDDTRPAARVDSVERVMTWSVFARQFLARAQAMAAIEDEMRLSGAHFPTLAKQHQQVIRQLGFLGLLAQWYATAFVIVALNRVLDRIPRGDRPG